MTTFVTDKTGTLWVAFRNRGIARRRATGKFEYFQDENVPGASIFTAVQEQLGLRLEAKKAPVEILIIDHADKVPTAN